MRSWVAFPGCNDFTLVGSELSHGEHCGKRIPPVFLPTFVCLIGVACELSYYQVGPLHIFFHLVNLLVLHCVRVRA